MRRAGEMIGALVVASLVGGGCESDGGGPSVSSGETRTCGGAMWSASDQADRYFRCNGNDDDEWACTCDTEGDEWRSPARDGVDAQKEDCPAAMEAVCGVDLALLGECPTTTGGLGVCQPTPGDDGAVSDARWSCRCVGEEAPTVTSASSCGEALRKHCMAPCSGEAGECAPTDRPGIYDCSCAGGPEARKAYGLSCDAALGRACTDAYDCEVNGDACTPGEGRDLFTCACTSYYEATRQAYGESCEQAHKAACDPTGAHCNGWSGFCGDGVGTDGDYRYDCQCIDGGSGLVTPEELGGTDDCALALEHVCGVDEPPEGYQCSEEGDGHTLTCTQDEVDGQAGYRCLCKYTCDIERGTGVGGNADFVETDTCEEALATTSCGDC